MKAVATGKLFGGLVDCYVLEDGRRVLSQRGAVAALTQKPGESSGPKNAHFDRFLERLPDEFRPAVAGPSITFDGPTGPANAVDAEWFVDILNAYAEADDAEALHPKQLHLARNANRLLRTLAKVGIVAMVDEATGYEKVRHDGALQTLFHRLFAKPAPWEAMFQPSLVTALCQLDGHRWTGGPHPRYLASTNAKIYQMVLGSEAWAELKSRNPEAYHGSNNHQHFAPEAREAFRGQLAIVEVLANQSRSKNDFWARMARQYGNGALQLGFGGPDFDPDPEPA